MKEILIPNKEDCSGCYNFLPKGTRVADRFPVKKDSCVQMNIGNKCIGHTTFAEYLKKQRESQSKENEL